MWHVSTLLGLIRHTYWWGDKKWEKTLKSTSAGSLDGLESHINSESISNIKCMKIQNSHNLLLHYLYTIIYIQAFWSINFSRIDLRPSSWPLMAHCTTPPPWTMFGLFIFINVLRQKARTISFTMEQFVGGFTGHANSRGSVSYTHLTLPTILLV